MPNGWVIPERVQVESAFGCNAACTMCPVHMETDRRKGIMKFDLFTRFVDELAEHRDKIDKFDFWGLGEPLLDKKLFEKIRYAKKKGFRNTAIATNADFLDSKAIGQLLESGLDTVILSIDGFTKETHEGIRVGVDFDRVMRNSLELLERRDAGGHPLKLVVRFIRQDVNAGEWVEFRDFWNARVSKEKGDQVIGYDVHTWGGEIEIGERNEAETEEFAEPCHHVFDRLIVLADGTVPLCCSDLHHAEYALGNIKDSSALAVFNNEKIQKIRELHLAGRRKEMKICADCTILESEKSQQIS